MAVVGEKQMAIDKHRIQRAQMLGHDPVSCSLRPTLQRYHRVRIRTKPTRGSGETHALARLPEQSIAMTGRCR